MTCLFGNFHHPNFQDSETPRRYLVTFFPCAFPILYVDPGWLIVLVFEFSMFHLMTLIYLVSLDHNYNIYLIYIG